MAKRLKKLNIQQTIMKAAGNVGGAVATNMVTGKLLPMVLGDKADAKMGNMIAFGAGVMLPTVLGNKVPMIDDVAAGMRAVAGLNLVNEFVPGLAGIGTAEGFDEPYDVFPYGDTISGDRGFYDESTLYNISVAGATRPGDDFSTEGQDDAFENFRVYMAALPMM